MRVIETPQAEIDGWMEQALEDVRQHVELEEKPLTDENKRDNDVRAWYGENEYMRVYVMQHTRGTPTVRVVAKVFDHMCDNSWLLGGAWIDDIRSTYWHAVRTCKIRLRY